MIEYFVSLPIEQQTYAVLSVGWVMLIVSAAIRELMHSAECRNWARAMGVVGVALMSLQTIHATTVAEKLNTELMVRRGQHAQESTAVATQIADPVRVVAVASEYTTSVGEHEFSVITYSDGRIRPVFGATKRQSSISSGFGDRCGRLGIGVMVDVDRAQVLMDCEINNMP